MTQYENEIPKYLKQKESNISKANKKSKHKHKYEECLIQYRYNFKSNIFTQDQKNKIHTSLGSYCSICGKIGERLKDSKSIVKDYIRIVDTPIGKCYTKIPGDELYEKYHDRLPVFFVEDIYKDKYANLEENGK